MKTIKFRPEYIPLILSGEKKSTWRLFDDKDLQVNDVVLLIDKSTGESFGRAEIVDVKQKKLKQIEATDYDGHEKYEDIEGMIEVLSSYYGPKVTPESIVKIVEFKLLDKSSFSSHEYIKKALHTEPEDYKHFAKHEISPRLEHAIIGVITEAGELMDEIKEVKIYGRSLDRQHLIEETGDLMWYLALLADELGVSFEEIWEKNINKLRIRYPEKFSEDRGMNKDSDKEKAAA